MSWPKDTRSAAGAVTSRVFDPGTGWTLPEARKLLEQGYSAEHVAKVTGYPEKMLRVGSTTRAAAS
jgi:hypothetical protein